MRAFDYDKGEIDELFNSDSLTTVPSICYKNSLVKHFLKLF